MRPLARWGSLPLLATPLGTWALGLGEIELHSALNQPLNAEIELVSATTEELASLDVALAPFASFDRYGLERPAFLNSLVFEVGRNASGGSVIRVTSTQSIAEPFVTMLVEAEWARGRLLREYTVFLDPPVLLPAPASVGPVAPAQTRAPQPATAAGPISRANPPAPAPARAPSAATSGGVSDRATASGEGGSYGPVQNAETLWGIASGFRPTGVSINQAMVAIYRANPDAFGGNMNHLRRGAILRIPPVGEMSALSASSASAEVQRQNDAWQPAGAASPQQRLVLVPPTETPLQSAAGGGAATGDSNSGELTALRSQVTELELELEENQRLLELRNTELAALQTQLAAGDNTQAEVPAAAPAAAADPGRALESEQLFADESETQAADTAVDPLDTQPVSGAETLPAAEPVRSVPPALTTTTSTVADSPSLVDRIIGLVTSTVGLIAGGVLLILAGALMFLRRRKAEVEDATGQWEALQADVDDDDAEIAATARLRAQSGRRDEDIVVVEGGDHDENMAADFAGLTSGDDDDDRDATGTFSGVFDAAELTAPEKAAAAAEETLSSQTLSSQTVINLDQADPIAEADFHMAYGLYDQAADLVTKALEADPDNRAYRLKLLEVYFVWGNKDLFLESAHLLKQQLGGEAGSEWAKVIIMGKQICPDDALFADAHAAAGDIDLDLEAGDSPGLDLAFGADDGQGVDLDIGGDEEVDLDFGDLGDNEFSLEDTQDQALGGALAATAGAADDEEDILDIGERTQAGLEAALFDMDEEGAKTSPGADVDAIEEALAATQESQTIETAGSDFDFGTDDEDGFDPTIESPTLEASGPDFDSSPTVESFSADAETVESPALASGDAPTVETPTIETTAANLGRTGGQSPDLTAELDLGDLGLDISDIDSLDADLGDLPDADSSIGDTRDQMGLEADDSLLSATGVTQVLTEEDIEANDIVDLTNTKLETLNTQILPDSEETMLATPFNERHGHADTEIISRPEAFDTDDTGIIDLDLDLDDFSDALKGGDTVEQPRAADFDGSMFDDDAAGTPIDLDVGGFPIEDDEPTGTEGLGPLDVQTMTEVGTKLDLARAYIDMGDPEGAKSILEEVLSEGDSGQREEAQTLIDALPA